ncbi:MAG: competence/damage-inducible protein A, partial [Muribaculaceae bacterium]|nr:competence/damage-inducible protein A [Muribaculaceae bacterium]
MQYSIIVIGDELLIGQVTDTNSGWIARHLSPLGWEAKSIKVIADNGDDIAQAIDEAFAATDVVLMTGGLGPTKDDITKATLCQYFGGEMVLNEDVKRNVDAMFAKRGLPMNQLTAAQAMVPSSCRVIQNEVGTAPIMWFERDGKVLVSMPGVPIETQTMMERSVINAL